MFIAWRLLEMGKPLSYPPRVSDGDAAGQPTEVWFRNPFAYIRECAEQLVPNIAWDRGLLRKKAIDPQRQLELHYPAGFEYRILLVGEQGTAELRQGYSLTKPYAVYPTWEYGVQPLSLLERLLDEPVGANAALCAAPGRPDATPVFGQEHRVVIIRHPGFGTAHGRAFMRVLAEMQDDHPDAIIHTHGAYAFRPAFGFVRSGDIDPREPARSGSVMLGNGRLIRWEDGALHQDWINLHHMAIGSLAEPRNRCMFNIRAAIWAGDNFDNSVAFKTRRGDAAARRRTRVRVDRVSKPYARHMKVGAGDKFVCDQCSLQMSCKLFRTGGVCTISDSESADLAAMFNTRDSDRIIAGLGALLAKNAERAERGLEAEVAEGKLDPEVTKILNQTFVNGVKLAKLVDPSLAAASAPKLNVLINQGQVGMSQRPNVLTSAAVAELESQGISREDITPEMIIAMMQDSAVIKVRAIETRAHG